jgi:cellulose biosynthesis protein BcsQ
LVINQGDSFSLTQIFVSLLGVLSWRDLGFVGDVGVQKKTKGGLSSRRYRSPAHPHPVRILRFGKFGNLLSTIRRIQMAFNSALTILGILRTMYDARTNLAPQVSAELQKHFPQWLLRTVIPRTVRLAEAPSHGLPIIYFPLDGSADVPR